jgi:anti-anti-sigma factor
MSQFRPPTADLSGLPATLSAHVPGELQAIRVRDEQRRSVVTPVGPLDLRTAQAFDQCLAEVQARAVEVVVDLRAVTSVDIAGLRPLSTAWTRAVETGRRLEVVSPSGQVRRMLKRPELSGLIVISEPPNLRDDEAAVSPANDSDTPDRAINGELRAAVAGARSLPAQDAADILGVRLDTLQAWEREFGFPASLTTEVPASRYLVVELLALQEALPASSSLASAMLAARRRIAHPS